MNPLHMPTRCLTPCVLRSFLRPKAHVSHLYKTKGKAIWCLVVVFSKHPTGSFSEHFKSVVEVFCIVMVSFISLNFVLIQFLLFRQEKGAYNRQVRLMKRS